jgi:hypothetical protein
MKSLSTLFKFLANKYLLTGLCFITWIVFFDDRDLITNLRHRQELLKLEQSKKHYAELIKATQMELHQFQSNPAILEKYAREKYRMKKDHEDLYIIPEY